MEAASNSTHRHSAPALPTRVELHGPAAPDIPLPEFAPRPSLLRKPAILQGKTDLGVAQTAAVLLLNVNRLFSAQVYDEMVDALPTEPQYVYAAALVLPSGITVSVNTDGVPFLYPVCLLKVGLSRKEDARRLRKLIAEEDWVRASHYLNPRSDVRVSTKASRLYAVNNAIASITTGDRDVEHAVIEIGMFVPLLEGLNAPRKSRVENQLRKRFGRSLPSAWFHQIGGASNKAAPTEWVLTTVAHATHLASLLRCAADVESALSAPLCDPFGDASKVDITFHFPRGERAADVTLETLALEKH